MVVESPAKAKTIGKYLGAGLHREGVGRPRARPAEDESASTSSNGFEPVYEVIEGKKKVVAEIRKAARENESQIYLASDPDREGEAIAWHIAEEIKDVNTNIHRVLINEITKKGVPAAIATPLEIDMNKTDAQQARRILDRLVGYKISPILWNKVQRGLSAGRVQSVAVRLVCEREGRDQGVQARGVLVGRGERRGEQPAAVRGQDLRIDGEKAERRTRGRRSEAVDELRGATLRVGRVEKKERKKRAGAVHHVEAAAGRRAQAALLGEAHDGARAAAVRRRRARRRRARPVSSRTCVPTRRASPTTR